MLALLHKDFLMLRKEKMVWLMFGLACLGGLISGAQPGAAIFLLFFPVYWATAYSNAYDYKYGAEAVLSSLPLPRAGVVGAKYLLALTVAFVAVLLALVGGLALALAGPEAAASAGAGRLKPGFLLAAFGLCNLFSAIALAAYFRFGYLKSRWIVIILFVVPSVAIGTLTGSSGSAAGAAGVGGVAALAGFFSGLAAPAILSGASLAVMALSCLYSSAVFARKEF